MTHNGEEFFLWLILKSRVEGLLKQKITKNSLLPLHWGFLTQTTANIFYKQWQERFSMRFHSYRNIRVSLSSSVKLFVTFEIRFIKTLAYLCTSLLIIYNRTSSIELQEYDRRQTLQNEGKGKSLKRKSLFSRCAKHCEKRIREMFRNFNHVIKTQMKKRA